MMNRLWAHHFGDGIVGTPNDFGTMGESPTHPELLDWLAAEFVASGYSLKAMHRLMVTSATYCQTSFYDPPNPEQAKAHTADPGDHFLWRAPRRRLEGEAIRDAILQVAGDLNLRMGGPSAKPELPAESTAAMAGIPTQSSAIAIGARSMCWRSGICAIRCSTCSTSPTCTTVARGETKRSQPRRRLELLNSEFTETRRIIGPRSGWLPSYGKERLRSCARAYPRRLAGCRPTTSWRPLAISLAESNYERDEAAAKVASQEGDAANEHNAAFDWRAAVHGQQRANSTPEIEAVADFCHALINSNEFLYVD